MTLRGDFRYIKDVVHGFIYMPKELFKIIDTPIFQRLRNITQNSLAKLVYPGLTHSRFEHSLGVAYAMMRAVENMASNTKRIYQSSHSTSNEPMPEFKEILMGLANMLSQEKMLYAAALAGLLHDIGHLAWSHVFEAALSTLPETGKFNHEVLTVALADYILRNESYCPWRNSDNEVCSIAYNVLKKAYIESKSGGLTCTVEAEKWFAHGNSKERHKKEALECLLAKLLSSSVDLDRADYVLRDSIHSGVTYGHFDLERLYNVIIIGSRVVKRRPLKIEIEPAILDKGISTAENLLIGRVYMYNEVYLHNIVLYYDTIAQKYLTLLLSIALEIHKCDSANLLCKLIKSLNPIIETTMKASIEPQEFESLEQSLQVMTDPYIEASLRLFAYPALGQSEIASSEALRSLFSKNPAFLASLVALADIIVHRKRTATLILTGEHATRIQKEIEEYGDIKDKVSEINTNTLFSILRSASILNAIGRLWVVGRDNPLHPKNLTDHPLAITAKHLKEAKYAKILIAIIAPKDNYLIQRLNEIRRRLSAKIVIKGQDKSPFMLKDLASRTAKILQQDNIEEIENRITEQIRESINKVYELVELIAEAQ